jgi:hypothetical protein
MCSSIQNYNCCKNNTAASLPLKDIKIKLESLSSKVRSQKRESFYASFPEEWKMFLDYFSGMLYVCSYLGCSK